MRRFREMRGIIGVALSSPMKISILLLILLGTIAAASYDPSIMMPYEKIPGSSSEVSKIGETIQCTEARSSTKTCAEDCFRIFENGKNCIGFVVDSNEDCFLCKATGITEINGGQNTNIENNDILYLLQHSLIEPDIHLSMDDLDLTTKTLIGHGASGRLVGASYQWHVIEGRVGKAVDFNGSFAEPGVAQPECFCSFDYCTKGQVTVSLWIRNRVSPWAQQNVIRTKHKGLSIQIFTQKPQSWFSGNGFTLNYESQSNIPYKVWTLLTIVVDIDVGITTFHNGIRVGFTDMSEVTPGSNNSYPACQHILVGAKSTGGHYPLFGDLDDLKYFYRALTAAGKSY